MSAPNQNLPTIVVDAGRSGSRFLWSMMKAHYPTATILHEDILVETSQPRDCNRVYQKKTAPFFWADPALTEYLRRYEELLDKGDVTETG